MIIGGVALAALVLVAAVRAMPVRLTAQGTSDAGVEHIAAQTLAWSDAYRGTSSRDHPAMDGSIELAPPVQDGGVGG